MKKYELLEKAQLMESLYPTPYVIPQRGHTNVKVVLERAPRSGTITVIRSKGDEIGDEILFTFRHGISHRTVEKEAVLNAQTHELFLRAARKGKRIKPVDARKIVRAFLKKERARGDRIYRIALRLGNEKGETLDQLIKEKRWNEALQIIRRVKSASH